jgi:hypothetical protein
MTMMSLSKWICVFFFSVVAVARAVDFPGPPPGDAKATQHDGVFTLENAVISQSWRVSDGAISPVSITDKLTNATFDQTGRQLFRLSSKAPHPQQDGGVFVAIRLDAARVVALASRDGVNWAQLSSFPRAGFLGEPKLVRLGKMNLLAESKDYAGEAGDVGAGEISNIEHQPTFNFKTSANRAATREFPFPGGTKMFSCKIDKGTDKGMSWAPALALVWDEGKRFVLVGVRDKRPSFNVTTADGENIVAAKLLDYPVFDLPGSTFKLSGQPTVTRIELKPGTARVADGISGMKITANLVSANGLVVHWNAELRDGSSYVRQSIQLENKAKTVPLYGVEMQDVKLPDARTVGLCPGSPVVGAGLFLGVEMPGSQNDIDADGARIGFGCMLEISPVQSYEFGSVTGVFATGQLRRSFLFYIERERARRSSPFLHYNDWYDLGYSVTAPKLIDAATRFDNELVKKRGVPVMSYLIDDGWDDPAKALWTENPVTFPQGFAGVKSKMHAMNSHMSVWISPLGGYGGADERTADARKMGLIPPNGKLDFSYPAYKAWFQNRCLQLMREDGVNAFKWDKAGDGVSPHFMALLDIAENLRKANPNLFINVTVGTWPSPFWLNHIDSTWRNGSADVGWAGKGDDREKWLTYRDGYCHRLFVEAAPLYPLNSVMHHGIVNGRFFQGKRVGATGPHLKNEARSYFANGTSLQELYITPSMMTAEAWDEVADAAKWAHRNADVLVDSHWVGGDPLKLEPYGYAAWSPQKGTLMVRNPDDGPREIDLDAATVFDLPATAARRYSLTSPFSDQRIQSLSLNAGRAVSVKLEPFEVLVFDALPVQ